MYLQKEDGIKKEEEEEEEGERKRRRSWYKEGAQRLRKKLLGIMTHRRAGRS